MQLCVDYLNEYPALFAVMVGIPLLLLASLQGDHSGCDKPPVDIKTKAPFYYEAHVLKRDIDFGVNWRFVTT